MASWRSSHSPARLLPEPPHSIFPGSSSLLQAKPRASAELSEEVSKRVVVLEGESQEIKLL